jgi:hypothetical protein
MPTLETLPQTVSNLTLDTRPEIEEITVVESPVVEEVVEEPKAKK